MKRDKKQRKGISLIVLIITIIVMIILAGTIILTLNNSSVIGRAQEATKKMNEVTLKEAANMAYGEWFLAKQMDGETRSADEYVKEKLKEQGFSDEELGNLTITDDGNIIVEEKPTIPDEDIEPGKEETITQWEKQVATDFGGGNGKQQTPYQINDISQLAYLAKTVNEGETYKDTYFVIGANLDLGYYDWVPIGNNSERYFDGILDFKGFMVQNLVITNSEYDYRGLFGNVGKNAEIISPYIDVGEVNGNNYVGALVGRNEGKITDINIGGSVTIDGKSNVGNVAGYNSGTIDSAICMGIVTGKKNVGGIIGYNYGVVSNSIVEGNVIGEDNVGGIVGNNLGTVDGCDCYGEVQGNTNYGQIVGKGNE